MFTQLRNSDSTSNPRIEPNAVSTSKPKRRISFSGRKSVREFHAEEKPKSWNNSYEISDHLNSLENISTGSFGGDNFIPCHTQYKLPDCKENYSFSKNKRLINGRPLSENQNNVALAFEMETKNHDGEHGAFSYKFAKDNNMIVEIFCGEEKCKFLHINRTTFAKCHMIDVQIEV
ncbi:uncharacterized protein LOC118749841 isoform X2 [Rhagoletis pomonella]|uniref:uncharacterized protein LOC118749841 isoform X2 n=1 Tax=Rhagoletis pomonella TaxID=28610 RepID=UPI0017862C90|nr:uncharacterized protein LOC118749841 isoform X2 [Rhagoletis pomonella]